MKGAAGPLVLTFALQTDIVSYHLLNSGGFSDLIYDLPAYHDLAEELMKK